MFRPIRKNPVLKALLFLSLILLYAFCLPARLFHKPQSLAVYDREGKLLGARIADDGQWRFPMSDTVPDKFTTCLIAFEDKRFNDHFGVDPAALSRALVQNVRSGHVVSGASTLNMQVIRMSQDNPPRTVFRKVIEMAKATRLEMRYSKKEILAMYAGNAPFGGNVVGLEAASWRYFGKMPDRLSWGEAAALAVLPNAPALVHPGRNTAVLRAKRNKVLEQLREDGVLDEAGCQLAKLEPLPASPKPLPALAPHLVARNHMATRLHPYTNRRIKTTIDAQVQYIANNIATRHAAALATNGVKNMAMLVIKVKTNEVLAYVGNTPATGNEKTEIAGYVDNIVAPRSTGSILKPMLYASMLHEGVLLPNMLVKDVPTYIESYTPKNYDYTYTGATPASSALARSLNVPAVNMLEEYGANRFAHQLRKLGLTTISHSGEYYGLTLILGGAEANLWDLAGVYASMGRTLLTYREAIGKYRDNDFRSPSFVHENNTQPHLGKKPPVLSASSIWLTFEAMQQVTRPDEEKYWFRFSNARRVAWKTGTSFGNRDAWAIGVTPDYVVAVWVGNSNGEGRPGLTGVTSAAPLLFDMFNALPASDGWFPKPDQDMQEVKICRESGYPAADICPDAVIVQVQGAELKTGACPYHRYVFMDEKEKYQVHSDCEAVSNMVRTPWFVLPPEQEVYYKLRHPDHKELPLYRMDCNPGIYGNKQNASMTWIYPQNTVKIYVPVELDGNTGKTVFEVAHRKQQALVYWHLDDQFLGVTTNGLHQMAVAPRPGEHKLTLLDDKGEKLVRQIEILRRQ